MGNVRKKEAVTGSGPPSPRSAMDETVITDY